MIDSLMTSVLDSFSDMTQNGISVTIFSIILVLCISLLIAMFSPLTKEALVKLKILEEDEKPSSLLLWIVGIIIIVKLIQGFIVQPFIVEGGSMLPTYHTQEFLLVDKFSYLVSDPTRGNVIIFKLYENPSNPYQGKHLIKRIIGLPGERVVISNGTTTIYNKEHPNGLTLSEPYLKFTDTYKNRDITLGNDEYFVMGDNRPQSYDSRDWGVLHKRDIKGQVFLRIYPFNVASLEPGRYSSYEQ